MHIYPAPGLSVRDPVKKDLLPDKGRTVDDKDPYWLRRIADGDVVKELPKPPRAATSSRTRSDAE